MTQQRTMSDQVSDPMTIWDVDNKFLSDEDKLVTQLLSFILPAASSAIIDREKLMIKIN